VVLGFSRAAQRDDGHGGDSGGQRRRGEEAIVIITATATITNSYDAGICRPYTVTVRNA
jgi:hypothetical protein